MPERDKTFFIPTDRFSLLKPKESDAPHTARPKPYIENSRFLGYVGPSGSLRALSNRDHLILEILLTVCGQSDPTDQRPVHSVPLSSILTMLPAGTAERDLRASLDRLTRTTMTLDRVDLGFSATDLAPLGSSDGQPARIAKYLQRPSFQALLEIKPKGVLASDDIDPSSKAPVTLTPLHRWTIDDGKLAFDLNRYIRVYCRRDRLRRMTTHDDGIRRVPWIHLDLSRMKGFGGGFTISLYRHLTNRIGWGKRPRKIDISMSWDEIVDLTSYRLQPSGSKKGQIERAVLIAADRDFRESTGDFSIAMRWRDENEAFLDRVVFEIETALPDLRRIRSKRVTDDKMPNLSSDDRLFVARPDVKRFRVSMSAWSKVNGLYPLDIPGLVQLSTAFDLAIDEFLWIEDGGLVPYTTGYNDRKYRGDGLRDVIRIEGVDRAAVYFATEEMAYPDLTAEETRMRLKLDRSERYTTEDRMRRLEAAKRDTRWNRVERIPRPDGFIDHEIAEHRAAKEREQEIAKALQKERQEVRSIKVDLKRDAKNARRRQKRADEKEAARIAEMRIESERQETARILALEAQIEREDDDHFRQEYDRVEEAEFLEMIDD